jgi:hypothetical protein
VSGRARGFLMAALLAVSLPANLVLLARRRAREPVTTGAAEVGEPLGPRTGQLETCNAAVARLASRIHELDAASANGERAPVAGRPVLEAALASFKRSGAVERCGLGPELEALRVRLDVPEEEHGRPRRIAVYLGGATAAAPAGACVGAALRRAMAAVPVPAGASSADLLVAIPDHAPEPAPRRRPAKTAGRAFD